MREWFVTTKENGDGVFVLTDDNYEFTKHNLWINPDDELLKICYIYDKKEGYLIAICNMPFEDITIDEVTFE